MYQPDIYQQFQPYLNHGETILWTGQPNTKVLFTTMDIFLVPFSLVWGGIAIFFTVFDILKINDGESPDIISLAIGILFAIIGLYFIFGRFIYKRIKKQKAYYAITNQRVITIVNVFNKRIRQREIRSMGVVDITVRSNGNGSLLFETGKSSMLSTLFSNNQDFSNTGMEIFSWHQEKFGFYDIDNVNEVARILTEASKKA